MIEPVAFGYNKETSINNHFQKEPKKEDYTIQNEALIQFQSFVKLLKENHVDVFVIKDTIFPHTPDSIFPNNWISFHEGTIVIYPMFAGNRRKERRSDIINYLMERGYKVDRIVDYSHWELQRKYLEGTGSMVLDRERKIAYAALSDRTNHEVFQKFCSDFKYTPIIFHAYHDVCGKRMPVYHTNVMMSIGCEYGIICLEAINNIKDRRLVIESLKNKELIEISQKQMADFVGNTLQIQNSFGEKLLIISMRAYNSLDKTQINMLEKFNKIVTPTIDTIEKYGGGGVRCMLTEVF